MAANRSPVAVSQAINEDLQHRFRLGTVIGTGAAFITWLLNGYFRLDDSTSLGDALAGGVAFAIACALVFSAPYLARREWRTLLAVYGLAIESSRRRREEYGDGRVPGTPKQAIAWLARHPDDSDETRGSRIWALLVIGDLETARELIGRLPGASALDRFERAGAEAMLRLVEGGDPGIADLRRRASELDDDAATHAESDIALLEALVAAADGRDWRAPLLRVGPRVAGREALAHLLRGWATVLAFVVAGGLLVGLVAVAGWLIAV